MHELIYRLLVLVWFLSYMAAIYLALHMVVARFIRTCSASRTGRRSRTRSRVAVPGRSPSDSLRTTRGSRFDTAAAIGLVITGPLTRPVRSWAPGASEGRVRLITLLALVALWLGTRLLLSTMGGLVF